MGRLSQDDGYHSRDIANQKCKLEFTIKAPSTRAHFLLDKERKKPLTANLP
jgi:hypothetical protein